MVPDLKKIGLINIKFFNIPDPKKISGRPNKLDIKLQSDGGEALHFLVKIISVIFFLVIESQVSR